MIVKNFSYNEGSYFLGICLDGVPVLCSLGLAKMLAIPTRALPPKFSLRVTKSAHRGGRKLFIRIEGSDPNGVYIYHKICADTGMTHRKNTLLKSITKKFSNITFTQEWKPIWVSLIPEKTK